MKTLSKQFTNYRKVTAQVLNEDKLNELACKALFTKRERKLSGAVFFYSLLYVVRSTPVESLSDMCLSFLMHFNQPISRQAFAQRFSEQSTRFVQMILQELLLAISQEVVDLPELKRFFKEIKIMDSTHLSYVPSLKMQLEYRMLSGQVTYLLPEAGNVQDHCHCQETLQQVEKGALYLRDRGYYKLPAMQKIAEGKAFFLNRVHAEAVVYLHVKRHTLAWLVQDMILSGTGEMDVMAELGDFRLPVRLLIRLVPLENAKKKIRRAKHQARIHGNKMISKTFWVSCAEVLVTNANAEQLSLPEAFALYGIRGQVEVLFRALKSFLQVFSFQNINEHRVQTMAYIKMIGVLLTMDEILKQKADCWNNHKVEISELKAFRILCMHCWHEFLDSFFYQKHQFSQKLHELLIVNAVKEAPKGKKTPYTIIFSPMEKCNSNGP